VPTGRSTASRLDGDPAWVYLHVTYDTYIDGRMPDMGEQGSNRVVLSGSAREPVAGARRLAPVDEGEAISVTVLLARRDAATLPSVHDLDAPRLSHDEFAEQYGADPEAVRRLERFAAAHALTVADVNTSSRIATLSGSAGALMAAFGTELHVYEHPDGMTFRGRDGAITIPAELADVIEGVFGLDDRPQVHSRARMLPATAGAPFAPRDVGRLYGFPTTFTGRDQCIAILQFGGGYRMADLRHYFGDQHAPMPHVLSVGVDGARNAPGDVADVEVVLDVEVAGSIAPDAQLAVYFAPNTDRGFIDGVTKAVHDARRRPSVISISWGAPEDAWTEQTRTALDLIFAEAALLGVTILVAAGDHGAADRPLEDADYDGRAHVDFPASSPHVTSCGGTHLEGHDTTITTEKVWNERDGWATGGGVSEVFPLPEWQRRAHVPKSINGANGKPARTGRGVPDVAGNADSSTGYAIHVNGHDGVVGGTSAVAPLWAGLVALINEAHGGRVGFMNPKLYAKAGHAAFNDITTGDNTVPADDRRPRTLGYAAQSGWDPCTGLGTPKGERISVLVGAEAEAEAETTST
jgi:kumamolisin